MIRRRIFLAGLGSLATAGAFHIVATQAFAKEGHDGPGGEGHDDDGHDDDRDGDGLDQDAVLLERRKGQVISLQKALGIANSEVPGKVIDVKLTKGLAGSQYRIKIRRSNGDITTIKLDAKTGSFVGILGF